MAIGQRIFALALICLCCWASLSIAGALPRHRRRSVDEPSALEPLAEGELNGFLLKRLVEMCLDAGDRCNLPRLEAEAEKIGFSAEHGRAFHRLVGFCGVGGEPRLGQCVALAAGLTRQLLLGEEAGTHFRRLQDSLSRANTQAVADTTFLLTAERRRRPSTIAAAASGNAASHRRRRDVASRALSVAAELATGSGEPAGATAADATEASERGRRPKRSVSPFMFGMYAQFSKDCGGSSNQPCTTVSRVLPPRIRIVDE